MEIFQEIGPIEIYTVLPLDTKSLFFIVENVEAIYKKVQNGKMNISCSLLIDFSNEFQI